MPICTACERNDEVSIKGLCHLCYMRAYYRRIGTCSECGRKASGMRKGMCRTCHYESPVALEPTLRLLECRGLRWALVLTKRFLRHARKAGYSPEIAVPYSRDFARQLLGSALPSARLFAAQFSAAHRARLLGGARHSGQARAIISFLEACRLAAPENWRDIEAEGRVRHQMQQAPEELRQGLKLLLQRFDEERGYRRSTGERTRRRGTERYVMSRLAFYARWLGERGFSRWEDLTAERFRAAVASGRRLPVPVRRISGDLWQLKRFFELLHDEAFIERNPLAAARAPRVPALLQRQVSPNEVARAVRLIADPKVAPAVRAAGALTILHGCKLVDLPALRLGDYQPHGHRLYLRSRRLGLAVDPVTHDALIAYLAARPNAPGNAFFFVSNRSQKTGAAATSGFFLPLLRRLGIKRPTAHRRSLILEALRKEGPFVAARLFGVSRDQIGKHLSLLAPERLARCHAGSVCSSP